MREGQDPEEQPFDCPGCGAHLKPQDRLQPDALLDPPETTEGMSEDEWRGAIAQLLARGQKLAAVRIYREHTNTSLFEAKKAVDEMASKAGLATGAGESPDTRGAPLSGVALGAALLLLLGLIAVVVWIMQ